MSELSDFQQTFGRALLEGESLPGLELALIIHRNTCFKGLIDALMANYPTVAQLVGEEWFVACAREYARAHPPRSPVLATYGDNFAAYLESFPPAASLPYLADVARIDRLWVETHTAADTEAIRLAWVSHSAATIWIHHRSRSPGDVLTVDDTEEGILLTRPVGRVEFQRLDRAAFEHLEHTFRTLETGS